MTWYFQPKELNCSQCQENVKKTEHIRWTMDIGLLRKRFFLKITVDFAKIFLKIHSKNCSCWNISPIHWNLSKVVGTLLLVNCFISSWSSTWRPWPKSWLGPECRLLYESKEREFRVGDKYKIGWPPIVRPWVSWGLLGPADETGLSPSSD